MYYFPGTSQEELNCGLYRWCMCYVPATSQEELTNCGLYRWCMCYVPAANQELDYGLKGGHMCYVSATV